MNFLSGPRIELLWEYTGMKTFKGKNIIPIGPQELKISSKLITVSKAGYKMIVLTIRKTPLDLGEKKIYFHGINQYYSVDVQNRKACNKDGMPFGLISIKEFIKQSFGIVLEKRKPLLEGIIDQIPKTPFWAVIKHHKQVIVDGEDLAEKKFVKRKNEMGLPVIYYKPEIVRTAPTFERLDFSKSEYKGLIVNLAPEVQELFNKKMERRGTS
jgi:hypothetical protein